MTTAEMIAFVREQERRCESAECQRQFIAIAARLAQAARLTEERDALRAALSNLLLAIELVGAQFGAMDLPAVKLAARAALARTDAKDTQG